MQRVGADEEGGAHHSFDAGQYRLPAQLHNLDGIMSNITDAGDGGLRTRRGCRALIALGGLGDNSVQVCDRLAGKQSCSLAIFY